MRTMMLVLAAAPLAVAAQSFPSKPVRIIVPSGQAGTSYVSARALSEPLSRSLGQPVVVENRAGADGLIGMEACARAAPDGHTLCVAHPAPISLAPFVQRQMPYDAQQDFAPVVLVGVQTGSIMVNAALPANSLAELLALAKARPGGVNWGSWGASSISSLYLAWLQSHAGVSFNHVTYKTPDQAQNAVLAGEVDVMVGNAGFVQRQAQAGKLRPVAVVGDRRSGLLPGVPAFTELGYALNYRAWVGMFSPARVPPAVVQRLNAELRAAIGAPGFAAKFFLPMSLEPSPGSPEEFAAFLKADRDTVSMLVRLAGVRPE